MATEKHAVTVNGREYHPATWKFCFYGNHICAGMDNIGSRCVLWGESLRWTDDRTDGTYPMRCPACIAAEKEQAANGHGGMQP